MGGKMAATKDMTTGNPTRLLFSFSLPLMLGNIFQQFYTIVDTIIVGQGVGMQALASIGAADWLNWLFLWMAAGSNRLKLMVNGKHIFRLPLTFY